ncbi:NYN domain-containing protein [Caldicellulosiruptor naganoensis]|uniref:NYN domain-containing protein n=2 Tax=Caldicellulosiruptor naganoensis TaxID=29324 RepID=A0ABY7BKY1_9FIRM|nr:NYN domain-containing protein [Caldicellulosiruptor naganoensis]
MVDGYNFINAWSHLKRIAEDDLEAARKKLLDILADFSGYKGYKITIVFDSHLVKGAQRKREVINDIEVVFTKEGETADNYIERYVYENAKVERIAVVTSDYLEQLMVLGSGAVRIPPRELIYEIESYKKELEKKTDEKTKKKEKIEDALDSSIIEKLEKFKKRLDQA